MRSKSSSVVVDVVWRNSLLSDAVHRPLPMVRAIIGSLLVGCGLEGTSEESRWPYIDSLQFPSLSLTNAVNRSQIGPLSILGSEPVHNRSI